MKISPAVFIGLWLSVLSLLLAAPVGALVKRAVPAIERDDLWNAGATCRVNYYNLCTGWVWCWDGFDDGSRLGMVVESCCLDGESASLLQSTFFLCTALPCYYGFTGTIAVHSVDGNDCPIEPPIVSQPYCPQYDTSFFSIVSWGGLAVPGKFAIVVTIEDGVGGLNNPTNFGTDHPAAGPTGPQACGLCFPAERLSRSYLYGTLASPTCPGSTFNDGVCDANLFWDIDFACSVSVEDTSWGKIKSLYR